MHDLLITLLLACFPHVTDASADEPAHVPAAQPVAFLPRGLTSFGATTLDGWLYVFGGYHGAPHRYSKAGQSDAFYRVNLRDPRHVEELDGGVALQGAQMAAWNGRILRVGGMVAANEEGEIAELHSVADVMAWDPRTRAWSALPPLFAPRSSHDVALVADRLVAVGGWRLEGSKRGAFADDVAVLDLGDPDSGWQPFAAPFRRRALCAAPLGERVLVAGGMDEDGDVQPHVHLFDPVTGDWERAPDFPGEPFGLAAVGLADAVYASGKDGVVWRLEVGAGGWSRAGTLTFPRFFHRIVADDGGSLLVLGGIDEMRATGRVRAIERLDPAGASARATLLEIPAPFCARNRQGAFLRGNVLTLFGGNRSLGQHDFELEDFQSEAFALDLASLEWRPTAPFPERRQTIACASAPDGSSGFAVGGFGFADGKAVSRSSAYVYSFEDDAWGPHAGLELPEPRTQAGLARDGDDLWVFGGLDYDPEREPAFVGPPEVLVADLHASPPRFEDSGARLSVPRRAFACAELDGRAYLVGGMRASFELVPECEVFDFSTRTFASMTPPRSARVSARLVALGGKLYLCGGSSRGADGKLAPDPSIEVYDPASDRWDVLLERLPAPMPHMHAFALRDRLLLVSSHVDGPPTTRIVLVAP